MKLLWNMSHIPCRNYILSTILLWFQERREYWQKDQIWKFASSILAFPISSRVRRTLWASWKELWKPRNYSGLIFERDLCTSCRITTISNKGNVITSFLRSKRFKAAPHVWKIDYNNYKQQPFESNHQEHLYNNDNSDTNPCYNKSPTYMT